MPNKETEKKIEEIWNDTKELIKKYRELFPTSDYVTICMINGAITMNNERWGNDMNQAIEKWEELHD